MTLHELHPSPAEAVSDRALVALQRWARERPTQIALRHRRRGAWHAWRWIDVQRDVERLADGLRQQGFSAGARLALSGALEPSLLLLALAARQLGGHSRVISPHSRGQALQRQLRQARPTFAFVQRRESLAHWLHSGLAEQWPLQLFCAQATTLGKALWQVQPLSALLVAEAAPAQRQGWAQVAGDEVLWVDEGTEWQDGLGHLLQHWLEQGISVAFPENRESSSRDRREIAPTGLLLSSARVETLAEEIEASLAPAGSWRRRWCDWTLAHPQRLFARAVKARVRRLLGFQRLRRIEVPSAALGTAQPQPVSGAWLAQYLERAA